jgi:hypothetical protein
VVLGLFRAETSRSDELLDDGMIGRDLGEPTVAEEIDPRIADVESHPRGFGGRCVEVDPGHRRPGAVIGGFRVRSDVPDRLESAFSMFLG